MCKLLTPRVPTGLATKIIWPIPMFSEMARVVDEAIEQERLERRLGGIKNGEEWGV